MLRQAGLLDSPESSPASPPTTSRIVQGWASSAWDDAGVLASYRRLFRESHAMRSVEKLVLRAADTDVPVTIEGETGTGKELLAAALHYLSARSRGPCPKVRCASLPAPLLESELFGDEVRPDASGEPAKPGKLELASHGTLVLDDVGGLPPTLQAKLLHVLQEGQFFRIGGREPVKTHARVITATSRDLRALVSTGAFRGDLYYRLSVVTIAIPPLRERRDQIPSLVEHFREEFCRSFGRECGPLSPTTTELLVRYPWPGNVRELENAIKRYVVLGDERHLRDELELRLATQLVPVGAWAVDAALSDGLRSIGRRAARDAEAVVIRAVLERVKGNRAEAARRLRVSEKTLLAKLHEVGMAPRRGARSFEC